MSASNLPHAPRDAMRFGLRDAIVFDGLCAIAVATGLWRYPAHASGDVADMRLLDKVYWVYKGSRPILRAERGSGLEAYFARQALISSLPHGFEPRTSLRLSAVGDLMDHAYLAHSRELYRDVERLIFGADISMANLECVVADRTAALEISANAKAGAPLTMSHVTFENVAARYSFLATANNHSIDLGRRGVTSTIAAIRDAGVAFHGTNEQESDAHRATLIERNDIKVAIISHTFGVNGHDKPAPWIVNHTLLNRDVDDIDFRLLEEQLSHSRRLAADFVVVQLHWGMEFELYPRAAQIEVAHRIAELGADAIIGHHPHIVQPWETYRTRRDPARVVPIFYSLGNLTTPFAIEYMRRSCVVQLELAKGNNADGRMSTYVAKTTIAPVAQIVDGPHVRLRVVTT